IGMVTILLCFIGVNLGKKIGERFTRHATIFGACILILIAIELLIKG
ncbi:MAG: manganese efflux pump, partial [Solobacterium sp.]|nr:manganese efflux pump [Solobacterium sp.]